MEVYILVILIIVVIVLTVVLLYAFLRPSKQSNQHVKEELLESEKRQQEALFQMQTAMNQQLQQFQQTLTQMMRQDLSQLQEISNQRMFSIEKNVSQNLIQNYESTSKVFGEVLERMGKLDEGQQNLKSLSASIGSIQNVLTDKKTRGIYGEIELYTLLENAMGLPGQQYAKQYKLSSGVMADAVLFAKEPLRKIAIDSKFPLENYNRVIAHEQGEHRRAHAMFVSDVKKHVKTIMEKYIIPEETADFAFMFIPAEAIYSYIYASCDEVVRYSYEQKVYMVSPTTLMAYITAIRAIYLGVERNENIVQIQKELKQLQIEFERFEKRYTNVTNDFERSYQDMQQLSITAKKLIRRFHEIESVELQAK